MFRSAVSVTRRFVAPPRVQRRFAGGYFNKNIRVEENAGLREISYKTWEFDVGSISRLLGYMIIPGALFFTWVVEENVSFYYY